MRKYEPQPAEYLLHAKLVAESVPSTKQARRGGQARNGVPGILKIQDINTDTRLLFATSISYYLNT